MNPIVPEYPRKMVRVALSLIESLVSVGARYDAVCTIGLPNDARCIDAVMMPNREVWLTFESPSWNTADIPDLNPTFVRLYSDDMLNRASVMLEASQDPAALAWLEDYKAMKERVP